MGPASQLRKMGFTVHAFSEYHFRVNDVFDFWLPRGKWHDLVTGDRGRKPLDQIPHFVARRLRERKCEVNKEDFIERLFHIGWSKQEAEKAWTERQSKAV